MELTLMIDNEQPVKPQARSSKKKRVVDSDEEDEPAANGISGSTSTEKANESNGHESRGDLPAVHSLGLCSPSLEDSSHLPKKAKTSSMLASISASPTKKPPPAEPKPTPAEPSTAKADTSGSPAKPPPNGKAVRPATTGKDSKPIASIFAKPAASTSSTAKANGGLSWKAEKNTDGDEEIDDEKVSHGKDDVDEEGEDELDDEAEDEQEGQAAVKMCAPCPYANTQAEHAEHHSSPRTTSPSLPLTRDGKMENRTFPADANQYLLNSLRVPYAALVSTFEKIEATTKRLEILEILTRFLLVVAKRDTATEAKDSNLLKVVYLCINRVSI